jgi:hypothetical protein
MKALFMVGLSILTALAGCRESIINPPPGNDNLLVNPTFESGGVPSLDGWIVSDSSNVRFSTEMPAGGAGSTITLQAQWFAPWPNGAIYQSVIPPASGTHRYRLSCFAKRFGISGSVTAYLGRPSHSSSTQRIVLTIADTVWTRYSYEDTISTVGTDSFFITVTGGGTEILAGTSYFNTCRFEKLN